MQAGGINDSFNVKSGYAGSVRAYAGGNLKAGGQEPGAVEPHGGENPPLDAFQSGADFETNEAGDVRFILSFSRDAKKADTESFIRSQTQSGSSLSGDLPLINGCSLDVKLANIGNMLATLPAGTQVTLDKHFSYANPLNQAYVKNSAGDEPSTPPDPSIARELIGIQDVWDMGYTGKGQTIAVIDSGIYPHPDLKDKIAGWYDPKEGTLVPTDTYGHGTHVAGIAAGSGEMSSGNIKGVAPDAKVVGVRIESVSDAIKGIQWVIENKDRLGIGVINMSLGDYASRSYKDDPWAQATQKAIEAGLVVCVAAGNEGPVGGTINTPGIHPDAITVGAVDDHGTVGRNDDRVADFSSRGSESDEVQKPDVVAPGSWISGALAKDSTVDVSGDPAFRRINDNYVAISGTSMATPMVSGLAACLKQANPNLNQRDIKRIIVESCDKYIKAPTTDQGAGMIDAKKAIELALTWESIHDIKDLAAEQKPAPARTAPEFDAPAKLDEEQFLMSP